MKRAAYLLAFFMFLGTFAATAQQEADTMVVETYVKAKNDVTTRFLPMPEPLTIEKIFPALGSFTATTTNIEGAADVVIVIDSLNKGLVWIEGLPQGKIKAMLRQSPATYKIPAQKTADGKSIPEGTLVYDKEANVLNICLGCDYNETAPAAVFAVAVEAEATTEAGETKKVKAPVKKDNKAKVWNYTGAKVIVVEEQVEEENPAAPTEILEEQGQQ